LGVIYHIYEGFSFHIVQFRFVGDVRGSIIQGSLQFNFLACMPFHLEAFFIQRSSSVQGQTR
jgi:hypothetical protein